MKRYLPFAILAGVALFLWKAYEGFTTVESGEHVARVSWLPEAATDVSFYRSYSFTAYEFTIPEAAFLEWANDRGWKIAKIEGEPRSISRYHRGLDDVPHPEEPRPDEKSRAVWEAYNAGVDKWRDATIKTITHSYYYEWRQTDGGGVSVVYDLDTGRAYFQSNPR